MQVKNDFFCIFSTKTIKKEIVNKKKKVRNEKIENDSNIRQCYDEVLFFANRSLRIDHRE